MAIATDGGGAVRFRDGVLGDFVREWLSRRGGGDGVDVQKFAGRVEKYVIAALEHNLAIERTDGEGRAFQLVDLSDLLHGFVYYAVVEWNGQNHVIVAISEESELLRLFGAAPPMPSDVVSAEQPDQEKSVLQESIHGTPQQEKSLANGKTEVLLRYTEVVGPNSEMKHLKVKKNELSQMILELVMKGVTLDSMEVWSECRHPSIDVRV